MTILVDLVQPRRMLPNAPATEFRWARRDRVAVPPTVSTILALPKAPFNHLRIILARSMQASLAWTQQGGSAMVTAPRGADRNWVLIVAVDFDEMADHALREALAMAKRQSQVQLHAVHVLDSRRLRNAASPMDVLRQGLRTAPELLRSRARRLGISKKAGLDLHVHVMAGNPAEELLRVAASLCPNMMLIGASGQRRTRSPLGSVAAEIAQHAPCPTLLVRPTLQDDPTYERSYHGDIRSEDNHRPVEQRAREARAST